MPGRNGGAGAEWLAMAAGFVVWAWAFVRMVLMCRATEPVRVVRRFGDRVAVGDGGQEVTDELPPL